ncbi:MAG: phosphatase domain-containing protein [Candidatus Sericytochromatia bacterium]
MMKSRTMKLLLVSALVLAVAGCASKLDTNFVENNEDFNALAASSVTTQFSNQVEDEENEVLIDEEYYKQFPDKSMANDFIASIQAGVFPESTYKPQVNEVQANSFLSIFNKKAVIDIYDSYGNTQQAFVTGRVYKKKSITPTNTGDSKLTNIIRNIKYFTPDGISNVNVAVMINGSVQTVKTDKKGYFRATFTGTPIKTGVNQVSAKLTDDKYKFEVTQEELVADLHNSDKIGIVSDFDDTVKYTGVHEKVKMVKHIVLGNYKTDKPYAGTTSLYKGILNGPNGTGFECMHFVTGSPSSLYDRLQSFLKLNKFPQSSLEMKKPGSSADPNPSDTYEYKVSKMRKILQMYPNKKFVFFGDTTQKDTEVYSTIKKEFPAQTVAIYINNVTKQEQSNPRFKDVLLTNSAIDAAQDLFQKGVITQQVLDQVTSEVR